MIAKFISTPSFGAATRYVLDRDPDLRHQGARVIDTTMAGRTPEEFRRELELARAGNWRVQRPVAHIIVRTAPGDRQLSDTDWRDMSRQYLERMGYTATPYLVVKHDQPDQHVHIVASRVRWDGSHVKDAFEHQRSRTQVRLLEREHGLVHTQERGHERDQARDRDWGWPFERGRERTR